MASVALWLVPVYWLVIAIITIDHQHWKIPHSFLNRPHLRISSKPRDRVLPPELPEPASPQPEEPPTVAEAPPVVADPPRPEPKARRPRRSRAAESVVAPKATEVRWVRVGPGQFVRMEGPAEPSAVESQSQLKEPAEAPEPIQSEAFVESRGAESAEAGPRLDSLTEMAEFETAPCESSLILPEALALSGDAGSADSEPTISLGQESKELEAGDSEPASAIEAGAGDSPVEPCLECVETEPEGEALTNSEESSARELPAQTDLTATSSFDDVEGLGLPQSDTSDDQETQTVDSSHDVVSEAVVLPEFDAETTDEERGLEAARGHSAAVEAESVFESRSTRIRDACRPLRHGSRHLRRGIRNRRRVRCSRRRRFGRGGLRRGAPRGPPCLVSAFFLDQEPPRCGTKTDVGYLMFRSFDSTLVSLL